MWPHRSSWCEMSSRQACFPNRTHIFNLIIWFDAEELASLLGKGELPLHRDNHCFGATGDQARSPNHLIGGNHLLSVNLLGQQTSKPNQQSSCQQSACILFVQSFRLIFMESCMHSCAHWDLSGRAKLFKLLDLIIETLLQLDIAQHMSPLTHCSPTIHGHWGRRRVRWGRGEEEGTGAWQRERKRERGLQEEFVFFNDATVNAQQTHNYMEFKSFWDESRK